LEEIFIVKTNMENFSELHAKISPENSLPLQSKKWNYFTQLWRQWPCLVKVKTHLIS